MNDWMQLGSDIDGESPGDSSGNSVSMSGNGQTVAIGAYLNRNWRGQVRIYTWISGQKNWMQVGSDIHGEASDDWFGYSVSMSVDGETVAIGGP
mmetsp:Transcript_22604/g.27723  ORF Transcript_22604/g.27723 Transcript_22604/m.27723 type:complete len:94 (+) Transcript_22604:88-369(+)